MLYSFLLCSNVNQLYIYTYPLLLLTYNRPNIFLPCKSQHLWNVCCLEEQEKPTKLSCAFNEIMACP